jgi:hypothetical protein
VAGSRRTRRGRAGPLPREVLRPLEDGQRAAADAVRRFLDTVEGVMPRREGTRDRQEIVDSALEMTERLIQAQYDILRRVVQSAGRTIGESARER